MSPVERTSEASSTDQANERAVRVNERAEERMAQYSTRPFHVLSTHCALLEVFVRSLARSLAHSLALELVGQWKIFVQFSICPESQCNDYEIDA